MIFLFFGFFFFGGGGLTYLRDTGAETIVWVIKDVLLKLQLSLAYYRGQSVTTAQVTCMDIKLA